MGFGGGGSAGMTNHVHNSVPLQGGPLDFANDTIASLNAGSTTFSNGTALQELVIGNAADTLVVNGAGTAPEWGAPGGGVWTADGTATAATPQATLAVAGMTGRDITQVIYSVADDNNGGSELWCQVNGTSTNYNNLISGTAGGGTGAGQQTTGDGAFLLSQGGSTYYGHAGVCYIFAADANFPTANQRGTMCRGMDNMWGGGTNEPIYIMDTTGVNSSITAAVTSITVRFGNGVQDIQGNIQVNSMNYQ